MSSRVAAAAAAGLGVALATGLGVVAGLWVAVGLGLAALGVGRLWGAYRQSHPELVRVGEISRLFIYPVKSCKGIPLTEVEVDELGMKKGPLKDRQWLIVDEKWRMITDPFETANVKSCEDVQTVYNDTSSCMMMSEATVEDFNTKLEIKVKMENFRPVVVVKDCKPYAEDTWKGLQIGTTKLYRRMACTRCIFTTVDPDTGIIDKKEPLETLKRYRQCDPAEKHIYKSVPVFGSHYGIEKPGVIRVGDPVYMIVEQKE
ncbi:hypothetical protein scyTo_0014861 [Scyliorhinus torazame]|uniref:MOSC domain-containing protein n=1 Tax=Scyliorhinus torazame TaxID=75743 RepID=A0A401NWC5_SCYTO|nr:hypothetical protein [Scyliorhinus torazame]